MPRSPHGSWAGSFSEKNVISLPPTRMKPSPASTVASSRPSTESCLSRCAIVAVSPRSFAATISKSPPRCELRAEEVPPDPPEPVDPDPDFRHVLQCLSSSFRPDDASQPHSAAPDLAGAAHQARNESAPIEPASEQSEAVARRRRRADREAPRTTLPVLAPHPRPWQRTGSESAAGRARTRRCRV